MDRRAALVAVAAAAGLLAVLAAPLLRGQVYTFNDLGLVHLPVRAFFAECLAAGHSFLWWPNNFTGVYLHGEGQAGLLHPLQWSSYRLLPLAVAFQLELLRSPLLALVGTTLLLRRWPLDRSAALLGGLLVGFSGFLLLHYMHLNLIGVWAHLPWLLLCIHVALSGPPGPRRAAALLALVILTASQLLLGHAQGVWLSLVVEAPYALLIAWQSGRWRGLAPVALAGLLGLGAGGVQLLPTLDSFASSSRAGVGPDFGSNPALALADLAQLFGPYLYETRVAGGIPWERGLWPGAVPLVLAVWALLRRRELGQGRPLALFGLALAGVGLWLALGDQGGLYRLQRAIPGLGFLRAPARYVSVFQLGLALTAAVSFHDLLHLSAPLTPRRLWPLFVPAALGVICLLGGVALAGASGSALSESPLALVAGPLLLLTASAAVALAASGRLHEGPGRGAAGAGRSLAMLLLIALAAMDLGSYGIGFVRGHRSETVDGFVARIAVPPVESGQRVIGDSAPLSMRVPLANGYLGLVPERRIPLESHAALRLANVGFAAGSAVDRPLPRVRLVARARLSAEPARDLARVDVENEARAGVAKLLYYAPGEIVVSVSSPGRQLLVVSESYHPGWRASVDAADCEVERVYGDYLGCVVEPGDHHLTFDFDPPSLRRGAWLSAACLAIALLWCGVEATRARPGGQGK
jgi:hypothetical protein